MVLMMLVSKDLYYEGEIVEVPNSTGRAWVGLGLAKEACPECHAPLIHEGGCIACYCCGFAKCG
ncbi:MAG: hypothetical protein KGZ75_13725 [Syntrophomonadaceae bacterium]|nr:hypothetical protein [Syntrophomonadaceae bacterium]